MIMLISSLEQMLTLKRYNLSIKRNRAKGSGHRWKRTPRGSDAAHREEGMLQDSKPSELQRWPRLPKSLPLLCTDLLLEPPKAVCLGGKALLLSAMDCAPEFCQNGKKESNESWRRSLSAYWFFLSSGGKYGGGGGWSCNKDDEKTSVHG